MVNTYKDGLKDRKRNVKCWPNQGKQSFFVVDVVVEKLQLFLASFLYAKCVCMCDWYQGSIHAIILKCLKISIFKAFGIFFDKV